MNRTVYNKLVRDNIPEIIKKNKGVPQMCVLDDERYLLALKEKLMEEAREVLEAKDKQELIGELADVLEVLESIAAQQQITWTDVQRKKEEKKADRGGFEKRLFLEHVDEPESSH